MARPGAVPRVVADPAAQQNFQYLAQQIAERAATAALQRFLDAGGAAYEADVAQLGYGLSASDAGVAVGRAAADAGMVSGAFTPDFRVTGIVTATLTGNATLQVPQTASDGVFVLRLQQDATGGRTLTLGAGVYSPGGTGAALTPTAGAVDVLTLLVLGGAAYVLLAPDFR